MPLIRKIETKHVFILLALFWAAWVYTEVTEYASRSAHEAEVDAFMSRGDRFTKERGDALEARIDKIEKRESEENARVQ